MAGLFSEIQKAPADAIFEVKKNYEADTFAKKVDVGIGAYRDDSGKPYVLNIVKEAEERMKEDNHEYLGIGGMAKFIKATKEFAFGKDCPRLKSGCIATVQSLSGTGALRLGMDMIAQAYGTSRTVLISTPTWGNHMQICYRAGLKYKHYRYWNQPTRSLDFEGMIADLNAADEGSIILLHMCAHNPTGVDPTQDQWRKILEVCQKKHFIPFFDSAYQGFASGDVDRDAFALRLFADAGLDLLMAQSYSKNMGLYGERIGALNVACSSQKAAISVDSQLKKIIRAMYSNPPKHGAGIVGMILSEPEMKAKWLAELKMITDRIKLMRASLRKHLEENKAPGNWSFITNQIGMFTYTGMTKEQVQVMQKEFHIYMPFNGRISIAGLNSGNVKYVADAITKVLISSSSL